MAGSDTPAIEEKAARAAATAATAAVEPLEPQEPLLSSIDTSLPDDAPAAVAPVALPELAQSAPAIGGKHLGLLLDVGVEVAAVVGTRELKLEQVMAIQTGSIIDLDKHAGQPIELYVNGKPIALAEIVVVDGRLGARVVQSLSNPNAR
jgi:flagellar motor switch protein FliN/FliY